MTVIYISKEFKVNDFITLKLENEKDKEKKTILYVKGRRFNQCSSLLFNIPSNRIDSFNQVRSIDILIEEFNDSIDTEIGKSSSISAETEFWGHCSVRHEAVWLNAET